MNIEPDSRSGAVSRRGAMKFLGAGAATFAAGPVLGFLSPSVARAAGPAAEPVTLVNVRSGHSLDVFGRSTDDGAAAIQWPASGATNQQWVMADQGDGWVSIGSAASQKVLDVESGSTADGARVIQWSSTGDANQLWRVDDAGRGRVKIVSRHSGKLLSVAGSSTDGGAATEIRADGGDDPGQLWLVMPVQGGYRLDAASIEQRSDAPLAQAGGAGGGVTYGVTRNGWSRNDRAWYPVSGEFHYLRYPEQLWDRELGKLRAAGVDVVATYVFWNHHEQPEGTWSWTGRRNLRAFVAAAQRQGLLLWLRVGPYVNAEALDGGVPPFALPGQRTDDPGYLTKVGAYLSELADQVAGQYVKDGGPIVGIQLENEFAQGDPAHIDTLRRMVVERGMEVPYYTVTANSRINKDAGIPLQGAYSYRGWEWGGGTYPVSGFVYGSDEWSANTDLGGSTYATLDYPRGFCELGTGSPMRGADRFLVRPEHVMANAYDAVGRGANYLGYYMFHGGTQTAGLSGDWPLTYDFQAPLGEFGQTRESYRHYRRLHSFVAGFTDEIVRTRICRDPAQIMNPEQTQRLRHIGRFDSSGRGFLFVNNTQRNVSMPTRTDVQVRIETGGRTLTVPNSPLPMPPDRCNVFPVMTDLNGVDLYWATVQPLAKLAGDDVPTWVFWAPDWTDRALAFDKGVVLTRELGNFTHSITGGELIATVPAGQRTSLLVRKPDGTAPCARIVVLSEAESLDAVVVTLDGRPRLVVAAGTHLSGLLPEVRFTGAAGAKITADVLPAAGLQPGTGWTRAKDTTPFARYTYQLGKAATAPRITSAGAGQWRITSDSTSLSSLAEAQLVLDYSGGEATLVGAGTVISNDLYHGEPWTIELKRLDTAARADLVLKVSDWDDSIRGVPKPSGVMPDLTGWTWQPLRDAVWG